MKAKRKSTMSNAKLYTKGYWTPDRRRSVQRVVQCAVIRQLIAQWREKADKLQAEIEYQAFDNYKWSLQGRVHALRDAAYEAEKALNS